MESVQQVTFLLTIYLTKNSKILNLNDNFFGIPEHRGFNGPIPTSNPTYTPGLSEWLDGGRELGYPVADPNGPQIMSQ